MEHSVTSLGEYTELLYWLRVQEVLYISYSEYIM